MARNAITKLYKKLEEIGYLKADNPLHRSFEVETGEGRDYRCDEFDAKEPEEAIKLHEIDLQIEQDCKPNHNHCYLVKGFVRETTRMSPDEDFDAWGERIAAMRGDSFNFLIHAQDCPMNLHMNPAGFQQAECKNCEAARSAMEAQL